MGSAVRSIAIEKLDVTISAKNMLIFTIKILSVINYIYLYILCRGEKICIKFVKKLYYGYIRFKNYLMKKDGVNIAIIYENIKPHWHPNEIGEKLTPMIEKLNAKGQAVIMIV